MDRTAISSPSNPRIRAAARLRDRRERDRTGLTLVDGAREVRRALEAGVEIVEAYVGPGLEAREDGAAVLRGFDAAGVAWVAASDEALGRLAFGDRSEGVVAVIRPPSLSLALLVPPEDPLVVVAEGVEKPGNLGAILRSADGAGASAVIVADARTDAFNPNAIRASLGTVFRLPVAAATSGETLEWLLERGIRVVAARAGAPDAYTSLDLRGPLALVLGSEADGLTPAWDHERVIGARIPMRGVADSLNVSVAAAVLLYEAIRQRGAP